MAAALGKTFIFLCPGFSNCGVTSCQLATCKFSLSFPSHDGHDTVLSPGDASLLNVLPLSLVTLIKPRVPARVTGRLCDVSQARRERL